MRIKQIEDQMFYYQSLIKDTTSLSDLVRINRKLQEYSDEIYRLKRLDQIQYDDE
jgi:hypothetical protein